MLLPPDDPTDGSRASNQGVRLVLRELRRAESVDTVQLPGDAEPWNARVVFRLSGTGVGGATLRVYFERYAGPEGTLALDQPPRAALQQLVDAAKEMAMIPELTGETTPTTIT